MCGIHFILDKTSQLGEKPIRAMLESSKHRGPDDSGLMRVKIKEAQYFLGANKLNITDISKNSAQPFTNEKGSPILIFNGEIYNYQDLKNQQLSDGFTFQSSSDTEVLYNHLTLSGLEGIKKLNGMYALIFLDVENSTFIVARDKWGMKPLFSYEDDDFLIYSSEITGILASGLARRELNHYAVHQYLKYKYVRNPDTFFKGIREFKPNSFLSFGNSQDPELSTIHEQSDYVPGLHSNQNTIYQEVDHLLTGAIFSHLAPSGSTGLFLSGGVDSTLLLAKFHELGIRQVPTFSLVSSKKDRKYGTSDYKFARAAAKQYQSTHHEILTSKYMLNDLNEFVETLDQPVGDSASLMTYLLSKEASKSLRVVFSGAGADEMFAGYNRHRAFHFYLKNYFWLKYLKNAGKLITPILNSFDRNRARLIGKFFSSMTRSPHQTWDRMISLNEFVNYPEEVALEKWHEEDLFQKCLSEDRNFYLINDVLAVSDRMTMRSGMEMRLPYLDSQLSSFMENLPSGQIIKDGPKHILKKLLIAKGGAVFAKRAKEGFGLPFGNWIDKEYVGLWEFLNTKDHIVYTFVHKNDILKMIQNHRAGVNDHSIALWSILILALWMERNFS